MSNCEKCKCSNIIESEDGYYCFNCGWDSHNNQYKKVTTNADRIRQMTDEELAEFLLKVNTAYAEPCMVSGGDCKYEDYPTHDKGCKDCFLEYLRKEVEEKDE